MLAHAPWTEDAIWRCFVEWFVAHPSFGPFAKYETGADFSDLELTAETRAEDFNWKRFFSIVLREHPKARVATRISGWCAAHGQREELSLADMLRKHPHLGSESTVRRRRKFAVKAVQHVLNNRLTIIRAIEHRRASGKPIPAELLLPLQPRPETVRRLEEEVGLAA